MPVDKLDGSVLRKRDIPYDIIPRVEVDSLECGEAMAIYLLMATRPPNWIFRKKWIMDRTGFGEDRYKRGMSELKDKGMVTVAMIRDEKGRLEGKVLWFHPTEVPENRISGKPITRENSMLKDTESSLKKQRINSRFAPPSVGEVSEYVREMGYGIDAEAFVAYYDSIGWMVGKNKMKSWKKACTTWQLRTKPADRFHDEVTE